MTILQTPETIKEEHQAFHDELLKAIESGGEVGKIAKQIDNILNQHFKIEEESAFPPLILMGPLSRGEIDSSMKDAMKFIERLKHELPQLTSDHLEITQILKDFDNALKTENKFEFTQFSQKLTHHARAEEGILYPAAILIGEYLSLRLSL